MTAQIALLSRNKKVIPICFSRGSYQTTNVRLPDIVFTNGFDHPVTLEQVTIRCSGGGTLLAIYHVPMERLSGTVQETTRFLQELNQTEVGRFRIGLIYGEVIAESENLSLEPLPGCHVLLPLSEVVLIDYHGFERIQVMDVEVSYRHAGITESVCLAVPMIDYRCRGNYRFPLRSSHRLYYSDNPAGSVIGHRQCRSQEFAIDTVAARQAQSGSLVIRREDPSTSVRDHLVFGADVLAIGDGVVVEASNFFPDALLDTIDEAYDARKEQVWDEMSVKAGGPTAIGGNYVVIDHENGEFSEYDHLAENSITVKAGDRVRQGQVIGSVGNTGYSSVPHLHLQLMDGPSKTKANGLPILFQDINAKQINEEVGEACNTLMFSPYLYFTLAG